MEWKVVESLKSVFDIFRKERNDPTVILLSPLKRFHKILGVSPVQMFMFHNINLSDVE